MSRFNNLEFGNHFEEESAHSFGAPKDEQFYLTEAKSAFEAGRFEEGLRLYSKVLEFNPRSASAWTGQVRMLIELGEFKEANLWADKALETFPEEAELLASKAVALAREGDLEGALHFSDAAVASAGTVPYVWLARADVLLARSEKRADFCFGKAFALAAHDWVIHWLASRICYFYGKYSQAFRLARQTLELDAARAVVWLQFGRCQLALGLSQAASNSFEHARGLDPMCQPAASDFLELGESGLGARLLGWWRRLAG